MSQPNLAGMLKRAAVAGALAVTLAIGAGADVAIAEDDDDELLDQKIFRSILTGIGLRKPGTERQIEYRERSPLVVPPSRDLPPPETTSSIERNPAWPVDQEVKRRSEAAAQKKNRKPVNWEEEARPLSPSQLSRSGPAPAGQPSGGGAAPNLDPMKPSDLGYKGGLFSFGSFLGFQKEEYAKFEREPPRLQLTDPPVGYRTPAASQPYGVGKSTGPAKPANPLDRPVGNTGTQ